MTAISVPPRSEIAHDDKWNYESLFADKPTWEAELKAIEGVIGGLSPYEGKLADNPATLADAFEYVEDLVSRMGIAFMYGAMFYYPDTGDQNGLAMMGRARSLYGRVSGAVSFLEPEVIAIGYGTIKQWMEQEPRLQVYAQYFEDLFRRQAHVRSAEVEEVLGMLSDPFGGVGETASILTDSDMKFRDAVTSTGETISVSQGSEETLKFHTDREARRTAWESYTDGHLAFKNTLASTLSTSIKQCVFKAQVRGYDSSLAYVLDSTNIPIPVFDNLLETVKKNLPTWHRYWRVRRKALGVEKLHPYDIWAPLTKTPINIPFEQSVDWICEGLRPLGDDYVEVMRRGCLEQRWIDKYPNQNKTNGAFSWGYHGTHPFILMSYDNTMQSMSTLAHELGHSMHSYSVWSTQPRVYADYSLFVAEVASNFHQAMVRAYLLETNTDPMFQIELLEEAFYNFHRYFFIMPTLARFEREVHQRIENGEGVTADDMIDVMTAAFEDGYGGEMQIDHERVGITWATFGHLYANFYVFQYATGISAANALANRILRGEPNAAQDYRNFLRTGSSRYPLDQLRDAGADMTSPSVVEEAFKVMAGYVDRLEALVDEHLVK